MSLAYFCLCGCDSSRCPRTPSLRLVIARLEDQSQGRVDGPTVGLALKPHGPTFSRSIARSLLGF